MTKIVEFRSINDEKKVQLKPIELTHCFQDNLTENISVDHNHYLDFDFVSLVIPKEKTDTYNRDLIACWDKDCKHGVTLFWGHWNDGVI